MQADLEALASRVEQAEGADRELDALIFRAIGAPLPDKFGPLSIDLEWDETGTSALMAVGEMQVCFTPPAYTASIDAALTLLDKIAVLISLSEIKGDGLPEAIIGNPETSEIFKGYASTMPLALCAASLRALSRTAGEGEQAS